MPDARRLPQPLRDLHAAPEAPVEPIQWAAANPNSWDAGPAHELHDRLVRAGQHAAIAAAMVAGGVLGYLADRWHEQRAAR